VLRIVGSLGIDEITHIVLQFDHSRFLVDYRMINYFDLILTRLRLLDILLRQDIRYLTAEGVRKFTLVSASKISLSEIAGIGDRNLY